MKRIEIFRGKAPDGTEIRIEAVARSRSEYRLEVIETLPNGMRGRTANTTVRYPTGATNHQMRAGFRAGPPRLYAEAARKFALGEN
jgi:hypothetical protein